MNEQTERSPEERMQDFLDFAADGGHYQLENHGYDCRMCSMSLIVSLLERHSDVEFLGAASMAIDRIRIFGSARLPNEENS